MSIISRLKTDPDMESGTGIDLDYGEDGKIWIHRAGGSNKKFDRVAAARRKPYERRLNMGTLDNDVARKLMIEIYADAVIIGWEGIKDEEGKDLPFTRDNVVWLMNEVEDLFADIQSAAEKAANFRQQQVEDTAGNSSSGSASTSKSGSKKRTR